METGIVLLLGLLTALVLLDLVALRFGTDSRDERPNW